MNKIIFSFALFALAFQFFAECHEEVKVDYTIWVGDDVTDSHSIKFRMPHNSNFFSAMEKAAELDPNFVFEYKSSSFGRFITSIHNQPQDGATNKYWMIYILDKKPNANHKPSSDKLSQVGVDGIIVKDKEYYLFWLQTVNYSH